MFTRNKINTEAVKSSSTKLLHVYAIKTCTNGRFLRLKDYTLTPIEEK